MVFILIAVLKLSKIIVEGKFQSDSSHDLPEKFHLNNSEIAKHEGKVCQYGRRSHHCAALKMILVRAFFQLKL